MRVNRNLDIRKQEMEEYLNACDNLVKAHPDWRLTETYVDVGLGRKAKKCDEMSFSKLFGGVFVSLFGDKFRF